jgi:hypothetical protein
MQAVEVVRYTDEEYNEHLVDPVSEITNFVQCTKCKNYFNIGLSLQLQISVQERCMEFLGGDVSTLELMWGGEEGMEQGGDRQSV